MDFDHGVDLAVCDLNGGGSPTLPDVPVIFSRLTDVTEHFSIKRNDLLTDLTGLGALERAGRVTISSNPGLRSLAGMDALQTVDGSFAVTANPETVNPGGNAMG